MRAGPGSLRLYDMPGVWERGLEKCIMLVMLRELSRYHQKSNIGERRGGKDGVDLLPIFYNYDNT